MSEQLKNPPLVEALCEFRFDPSSTWDWTIPGQMFDKIREKFPERSEVRSFEFRVQGIPGSTPAAGVATGPERVQLRRSDGSAMVQIGPHLLTVNHLRPYESWSSFRKLILDVFDKHSEIVGQVGMNRIGLRYINRIEVPCDSFESDEFITLRPPLFGPLKRPLGSFYQRYELAYDDPKGVLIHQTGIREISEGCFIMLDLDFGSEQVSHLRKDDDSLVNWLDSVHDKVIGKAFVASLNPGAYEKMKRGDE